MVSKLYQAVETAKVFKNSGGDVAFNLKNLSNAAGRISTRLDLGAYPRATRYRFFAQAQWQATPTQYNLMQFGLVFWDDESTPGDASGGITQATDSGTRDGSTSIAQTDLIGLYACPPIVVRAAAASTIFTAGGIVRIDTRYVSILGWNAGGSALVNTDGLSFVRLTPLPFESQ